MERCFFRSSSLCYLPFSAKQVAMAPNLTVEIYTPGEIVDSRRSYTAETAKDALRAAKVWITDGSHSATRLRVLDDRGTVMFDQPVTAVAAATPR
jgi:hypothetical protein